LSSRGFGPGLLATVECPFTKDGKGAAGEKPRG